MSSESEGAQPPAPAASDAVTLEAPERRVLGTLIEKNLSTPDYYPMTTKALVAGCNQKNAREPVSSYTEDDVRAALGSMQRKHLVLAVKADTGHATRWRHELDRKWGIQGRELAVLAELLLRGPQTEGELRSRAGRMRAFPDVESLHETFQRLREVSQPLIVRLSPEGSVRGVRHAHLLYPPGEMETVLRSEGEPGAGFEGSSSSSSPSHAHAAASPGELSQLRTRVAELESRLARIETLLNDELGASFPATQGAPRTED